LSAVLRSADVKSADLKVSIFVQISQNADLNVSLSHGECTALIAQGQCYQKALALCTARRLRYLTNPNPKTDPTWLWAVCTAGRVFRHFLL